MYNFLKSNQLLSKYQSGFTPKDSTELQLIILTHTLYEALECKQESVVVIFPKLLTEFGLKVSYINYNNMAYLITCFTGLGATSVI